MITAQMIRLFFANDLGPEERHGISSGLRAAAVLTTLWKGTIRTAHLGGRDWLRVVCLMGPILGGQIKLDANVW